MSKTIGAATTDYLVDLAATLPVVISDTDAVYLYGLDIIAEQLAGADRYYYVHHGLGSVRQLLDSTGQIATRYAYDPFGVRLAGNGVSNPWQFTGEPWKGEVDGAWCGVTAAAPAASTAGGMQICEVQESMVKVGGTA